MGKPAQNLAATYKAVGRVLVTPNGYVRLVFRIRTRSEAATLYAALPGAYITHSKGQNYYSVCVARRSCLEEALTVLGEACAADGLLEPHEFALARACLRSAGNERLQAAARLRRFTVRRPAPAT